MSTRGNLCGGGAVSKECVTEPGTPGAEGKSSSFSGDREPSFCVRDCVDRGKRKHFQEFPVAQWVKNLTSIHEVVDSIPGLAQCVKDLALP